MPPKNACEVRIPLPTLTLVSTQIAVTYAFRATDTIGWAFCTVNDTTGELLITSDWGNWSHRWDPRPSCLGEPTLTAFIGTRSGVDYLARKLQQHNGGRNAGRRWSAAATTAALRRQLCTRRLEDGRTQIGAQLEPDELCITQRGHYDETGLPLFSDRWIGAPTWNDPHREEPLPYLTRDTARRLWNTLGRLADEVPYNADLFYERAQQLDGFSDYITEEPWEYGETEQTPEDRALREVVLPALITACRNRTDTHPVSETREQP